MKKIFRLSVCIISFFCYHHSVFAQYSPETPIEIAARDAAEAILQAKAAEYNFTASMGNRDREINFHLNRSAAALHDSGAKSNNDFRWDFGDGSTGIGIQPLHRYEAPGTYTVTLRITNTATVVKENVFTVTATGLRVKYVEDNNIVWPNGDPTTMLSPFTHRLLNFYGFDYHRGLDIVGAEGDQIVSIADGYVYDFSNKGGASDGGIKILYIKHVLDTPIYILGQVISYYYSSHRHLEFIDVNIFQQVSKGQRVASLGRSGLSDGISLKPHNHFEIRLGTIKQTFTLNSSGNRENREGRYHDVHPVNNIHNEFNTPSSDGIVPDSRVNPYLLLNKSANENTSLRYTVEEVEDNLVVTVRSDFGEDMFNEIDVQYNSIQGNSVNHTINLNTREGMPHKLSYDGTDSYYDIKENDDVEIIPIRFHDRDLPGESFDFKMTFRFKNYQKFDPSNYVIKVKDIYGNSGRETNYEPGLVINEVNFESHTDYNLDGRTNSNNDDFIEIVNNSNKSINLKNYKIYDDRTFEGFDELGFLAAISPRAAGDDPEDPRFTLGDITLGPGEVLVIFNEISADKISELIGDKNNVQVISTTVTNKLNIGQSIKERVFLVDRYYSVLDIASNEDFFEGDSDKHYTLVRSPELTGDFVKRETATPGLVVTGNGESCYVIKSKNSNVIAFCL